jgi:asparagine synthase (glutamine-hydrolysing)
MLKKIWRRQRDSFWSTFSASADRHWLAHVFDGAAVLMEIFGLSEQFGVEKCFPYADIDLVEFVLSMPPEERTRPPRAKWLLRDAMTGVIPEMIRMKQFQPTGDGTFMLRLQADQSYLRHIVRRAVLGDYGLVDAIEVRKAFESIIQGDGRELNHFVRFLIAEFWLRKLRGQR